MNLRLKIQRLDADVPLPSYAHEGDAACDLFAVQRVELAPGERTLPIRALGRHCTEISFRVVR